MLVECTNVIGGELKPSASAERIAVENPATGLSIGSAPASTEDDAAAALACAHKAFAVWSAIPLLQRETAIRKYADVLVEHKERIVALDCLETGKGAAARRAAPPPPSRSPRAQFAATPSMISGCWWTAWGTTSRRCAPHRPHRPVAAPWGRPGVRR